MSLERTPQGRDVASLRLESASLGPVDAPPVLLLHGITASRRYWVPRARPLARRFRLHVPDLPGFGRSPKPFADYTMDFFVEALGQYVVERGIDHRPLAVIGHSLGALVALELAARGVCPVERMVLLNVPRFTDPDRAHDLLLAGSESYRRLLTSQSAGATWSQVRRTPWPLTLRYLWRMPIGVLIDARKFTFRSLTSTLEHCLLHYRVDDVVERLPDLPALLIHGARDPVAPVAAVRELAARRTCFSLEVLDDAGHNPFHSHTRTCLRRIEAFLAGAGERESASPPRLARAVSTP